VTGKIIKNMDSEFNFMVMEINMKVDGMEIKEMVKGLFGFLKGKIN